ncbi:MAG: hypothetical protein LBC93_09320, partial [Synergistaceae bacterium]|nr:hypothetical protein [Synergistaceae bacterium]
VAQLMTDAQLNMPAGLSWSARRAFERDWVEKGMARMFSDKAFLRPDKSCRVYPCAAKQGHARKCSSHLSRRP